MSDKNINKYARKYELIEDIKLMTLWSQSDIDRSLINKIQADINQPIVEEESTSITSKVVLFGVLATLVLVIAVTYKRASEISQSVQKVGINSFKELILKD